MFKVPRPPRCHRSQLPLDVLRSGVEAWMAAQVEPRVGTIAIDRLSGLRGLSCGTPFLLLDELQLVILPQIFPALQRDRHIAVLP